MGRQRSLVFGELNEKKGQEKKGSVLRPALANLGGFGGLGCLCSLGFFSK